VAFHGCNGNLMDVQVSGCRRSVVRGRGQHQSMEGVGNIGLPRRYGKRQITLRVLVCGGITPSPSLSAC
jgi:hypothetical protein